jgi:arsenite-transporting ATPase
VTLASAFDELADRRVLLFGGKGGVGKTTISVAAALHLAQSGREVVLFTTDPASNLSDLLHGEIRSESLDAEALYAQFLSKNLASFLELGDRGTYLDKDELRRFFELSLPGVDELMAWMRIGELAEVNPQSIVVVDTAPTGHTLRMLGAADHFRQFADALESMQAKHRGMVQQFTRRKMRDALDDFLDSFAAQARRWRELLTDPSRAAFVPVTLPEPWVIEQTKRLIAGIEIDVPFVILNRARAGDRAPFPRVVVAPRACVPLDTAERIAQWSAGVSPAGPPPSRRRDAAAPAGRRPAVRRLTFLAGKGGVGKTTCAASLALQLARTKKTTVISVDPAHSLRDVFAHETPPPNLTVETIDTREKWRRFRDTLGEEIERAVAALSPGGNFTVAYDGEAMKKLVQIAPPGADELFAINRLAELIADRSQEMIVVDTAPTGHFLRLLDLPKTAGEWVREFMRILLRYREVVPAGSLGEELLRASRALHSVEQALRSDDARVLVVTRPERVVVVESLRLIGEVERRGMKVGGVIANYVTPENGDECDRSMRAYETDELRKLGEVTIVERHDQPVTRLDVLATLIPTS